MKKVLVTGAAGGIGTRLRTLLRGVYPSIRWSDLRDLPDRRNDEEFVPADLTDLQAVERAVEGCEGIVHLGGVSVERPWEEVLPANLIGCYHLFEAARRRGAQRVVFASSNHAIGFYPRTRRIGVDHRVRPDGYYGVSKAFGEAMGALYAYKHGLRVTSLRIGNFGDAPLDVRRLSIWLKPEDLVQLIRIALEHPDIRCEIFWGVSHTERGWWDNEAAYRFGYRPSGRAEEFRDHAYAEQAKLPPDPVGDWYQGGQYCGINFDRGVPDAKL